MDHFAPHRSARFEGYYSKFRLPSGASIALIISTNDTAYRELQSRSAPSPHHGSFASWISSILATWGPRRRQTARRPYMISFTYVSRNGTWWQREYFPSELSTRTIHYPNGLKGFDMTWNTGEFSWIPAKCTPNGEDSVSWRIETAEISFSAHITAPIEDTDSSNFSDTQRKWGGRTPWDPTRPTSTPGGWMANLPLPIQWHVHSLDSICTFHLSITPTQQVGLDGADPQGMKVSSSDAGGVAHVHIEKNWAHSFPDSYIWIQARDRSSPRGICLAGGSLWGGLEAYLIGYHSSKGFISFAPPWSARFGWLSFGLSSRISWEDKSAIIEVQGLRTRLRVSAFAPADTFFTLGAPLSYGHEPDYTAQSFAADIQVEVFRRRLWSRGWRRTERETFQNGSLEFGGSLYKSHTS